MSGLLHVKLAKTKNCTIIAAHINPKKLDTREGAERKKTIDAGENVRERTCGPHREAGRCVILCTSALPAVHQAWQSVDKGGTVVPPSDPDKKVEIPINYLWMREVKILTSYHCGPPDITEALNLIESD